METIRAMQGKKSSQSLYDRQFHQPEGGYSTERTEKKEGRRLIIYIFYYLFFFFLLFNIPTSVQFYRENVKSWQAISRWMFRLSRKTKNVLWILAIDSLLQIIIWLKITDFRNVLLNPIFQRECNFADGQLSSKSMQVYRSGAISICLSTERFFSFNIKLTVVFNLKIFISSYLKCVLE